MLASKIMQVRHRFHYRVSPYTKLFKRRIARTTETKKSGMDAVDSMRSFDARSRRNTVVASQQRRSTTQTVLQHES